MAKPVCGRYEHVLQLSQHAREPHPRACACKSDLLPYPQYDHALCCVDSFPTEWCLCLAPFSLRHVEQTGLGKHPHTPTWLLSLLEHPFGRPWQVDFARTPWPFALLLNLESRCWFQQLPVQGLSVMLQALQKPERRSAKLSSFQMKWFYSCNVPTDGAFLQLICHWCRQPQSGFVEI